MEPVKYLIAIPTTDYMPVQSVASLLHLRRVGASKCTFLQNSLVYDARNMLSAEAIDTGADRVLWVDSDMVYAPDMMQRLAEDVDSGLDFVCGIFFKRRYPTVPILSKRVEREGKITLETYTDYPKDQLFEIDACGFGACMMTTKLLKDVWDNFGSPFYPINGNGEDYSFCERAKALGYKLYCDSRIKVGHVGCAIFDESVYLGGKENEKV